MLSELDSAFLAAAAALGVTVLAGVVLTVLAEENNEVSDTRTALRAGFPDKCSWVLDYKTLHLSLVLK